MEKEGILTFKRSAATFLVDALLFAVFTFVFYMGINEETAAAIIIGLAGGIWQTLFTVWLVMYPYARLEGDHITFYARYQKRDRLFLGDISGVVRNGNDIEISLRDGEPLSFSLFWMSPSQRELLVQALQP